MNKINKPKSKNEQKQTQSWVQNKQTNIDTQQLANLLNMFTEEDTKKFDQLLLEQQMKEQQEKAKENEKKGKEKETNMNWN